LFVEYKCNIDCWYCWSFDNHVKGMTEDVARRSIDWLHDHGCLVLATSAYGWRAVAAPQRGAQDRLLRRQKCVRWYLDFKLSYRDLVRMMADRGIAMSHTTIMCWVLHYVPEFEKEVEALRQEDGPELACGRDLH
jgi:hypothetical protein